jgi:hypothetical protein
MNDLFPKPKRNPARVLMHEPALAIYYDYDGWYWQDDDMSQGPFASEQEASHAATLSRNVPTSNQ